MKNRKVLNLRVHLGGILGKTNYDSVQNKADMELTPVGVLLKSFGGSQVKNLLIPYSNCVEMRLDEEVEEEKKPVGRPPKEVA
jgi:hypothetical protein